MSDSSDEEVPSSISFKKAQTEHENKVNEITDFLKRRREIKKEERRNKNDLLRSQRLQKRQKEEVQRQTIPPKKTKSINRNLPQDIVDSLERQGEGEEDNGESKQLKIDSVESKKGEDDSLAINEEKESVNKKVLVQRKVYKKLNIRVESLPHIENKRTSSALDFKSKRLAKSPREAVSNVKVHHEKLLASGQKIVASNIPIVSMIQK